MRESLYWPSTNTGRAKAMIRSLADPVAAGRVTSKIGYTRPDGVRIVRRWDEKGEMIQTKTSANGT